MYVHREHCYATCLSSTAPGTPPESVSGYVINSTSVFLGWEQPSADSLNGILRGYQINCTEVDTSLLITVSLEGLLTETIVSNLHPAYTYTCRVSAVTVDVGVFSGNITLEMDEAGVYYMTVYMRNSALCNKLTAPLSYRFILIRSKWPTS